MGGMQPNQRVEGSTEEVRANGEANVVDKVIPLPRCTEQKECAEQNGGRETEGATANIVLSERADRPMHSKAAREKTDGTQDREFQHLGRHRTAEALTNVVDIRNDK